jgi:hypothetical protein
VLLWTANGAVHIEMIESSGVIRVFTQDDDFVDIAPATQTCPHCGGTLLAWSTVTEADGSTRPDWRCIPCIRQETDIECFSY